MAKKSENNGATVWAILTNQTGSFRIGEQLFPGGAVLVPLTPVELPAEVQEAFAGSNAPLAFFATEESAAAAVNMLKAKFERRPGADLT